MTTNNTAYLTELYQLINHHFNLEEIRTLCFNLNVDYESVPGEEKSSQIREVLLALGRNGRLPELIALAQKQRPHVNWPLMPDDFQMPASLESDGTAVPATSPQNIINTGGGAYIGGSVHTGGGDFSGRDKIIHGDEMRGNEITAAFATIQTAVDQTNINDAQKVVVQTAVDALQAEADKGEDANASVVEQWLGMLVQIAPNIAEVAIDTFIHPITEFSAVFQQVAQKINAQQQGEK